MKPLGKVKIQWSSELAYAIGLIATGGSLSKDGKHITFTSKDKELVDLFQRGLARKMIRYIGMQKWTLKLLRKLYFNARMSLLRKRLKIFNTLKTQVTCYETRGW